MNKSQHYVQCKYLQKWADKDSRSGRILVSSKDGVLKNKPIGINNLCVEDYFYDVSSLSEIDIYLLSLITKDFKVNNKKIVFNKEMLEELKSSKVYLEKNLIGKIEDINNSCCFIDRIIAGDISFYKDSPLVSLYKHTILNFNNSLYGDKADKKSIDLIQKEFKNINKDVDMKYDFLLFFYYQYFRTKRNIDLLVNIFTDFIKENIQFQGCNLNNVAIINYIMSSNVAAYNTNLMNSHIIVYNNKTNHKFITADCPIAPIDLTQKNSAFIYPLSPDCLLKLELCEGDNNIVEATEENVELFNKIIYDFALKQIYSKFNCCV